MKDSASSAGPRWLRTTSALALLGAAVYAVLARIDHPRQLLQVTPGVLVVALGLRSAAYLSSAAAVHAVVIRDLPALSFATYLRIASRGTTLSYLASSAGGLGYRTAHLRYVHGLAAPRYLGITVLTSLLSIGAGGLVGLLGLLFLDARGVAVSTLCWSIAGLALLACALPVALTGTTLGRRTTAGRVPTHVATAAEFVPAVLVPAFLFSVLQAVASGAALGMLFVACTSHPFAFVTGVVADALTAAGRVVILTPANLGVTEWLAGLLGHAVGVPLEAALLAALLYRMLAVVVTLLVLAVTSLLTPLEVVS